MQQYGLWVWPSDAFFLFVPAYLRFAENASPGFFARHTIDEDCGRALYLTLLALFTGETRVIRAETAVPAEALQFA